MANPKLEVLTPSNSQLLFIDQQPQMAFGVQSIDRQLLKNNVVALAKAAKVFGIPTTITTVETESFSGHTYPEPLVWATGAGAELRQAPSPCPPCTMPITRSIWSPTLPAARHWKPMRERCNA